MLSGDTTTMTTTDSTARTKVVSVMLTTPDTVTSMASMSLVKRLSRRPAMRERYHFISTGIE